MRDPERAALRVQDLDGIARLRLTAVDYITGKNPRMAGGEALRRFAVYFDRRQLTGRLKTRDAVLSAGVRGEERENSIAGERLDDKHGGGGLRSIHRNTLRPSSSLPGADMSPPAVPVYFPAGPSAENSRVREIAIWISMAAMGRRSAST